MDNTAGKTRFCIKCGKEMPIDSEFCPYCGTKQPVLTETSTSTEKPIEPKKSSAPVKPTPLASKKPTSPAPKKPNTGKKWYKIWWVWAIVAIVAVGIGYAIYQATYDPLGGVNTSSNSSSSSSQPSNNNSASSSSTKSSSSTYLATLNDGTKIYGNGEKTYKPDFTDASWKSNELTVSRVNVFKTKPYKYDDDDDGEYTARGMIYVEFTYSPTIDIETLVNEATLSTDTGVQSNVDYMDSDIPDTIDSGVTKTFKLLFPISKLGDPSEVNTIRLKFSMSPDDDSGDMHDYDLTVNLTK